MCELANGENPFVGCENVQVGIFVISKLFFHAFSNLYFYSKMLYEKLVGFDIGLWDRNILNPDSMLKIFSKQLLFNKI